MRALASSLILVAACGGKAGTSPADAFAGGDVDAAPGAPDAMEPGTPDAAPCTALVRVHYPVGAHAMTIRGGGGGLDWTTGAAMTGTGDVRSYAFTGLTQPIEWKPLLDDATWARGPNYHVASGQTLDVYPHFTAVTGQVVTLISDFHSTILNNDRAIYAYLPASYDENPDATYPVVYMHDGQNLWAAMPQIAFSGTWNVDTAFDQAAEYGACSSSTVAGWGAQPLGGTPTLCTGDGDCGAGGSCVTFPEAIVIGVANAGAARIYEYTPTTDPSYSGGGGADPYLTMLATELKPQIDHMLRTRPDAASTSMIGSSLGGLVTAYAGLHHADVWSRLGEISPSSWWNSDVIVGDVTQSPASPRPTIVYVDSGSGTADDEADTDMLAQAYLGLGYTDGTSFRHVIQPGAQHAEQYWAERLPGALQLLLGTR